MDKHETARAQKKAELIETLSRLYPGVVSIAVIFVAVNVGCLK